MVLKNGLDHQQMEIAVEVGDQHHLHYIKIRKFCINGAQPLLFCRIIYYNKLNDILEFIPLKLPTDVR